MKHRWLRLALISIAVALAITASSYFVHAAQSGTECPAQADITCLALGCRTCNSQTVVVAHGYPYSYADTWIGPRLIAAGAAPANITLYTPINALLDIGIWFIVIFAAISVIDYRLRSPNTKHLTHSGKG